MCRLMSLRSDSDCNKEAVYLLTYLLFKKCIKCTRPCMTETSMSC